MKTWILESGVERMYTSSKDKKHRQTETFIMTKKFDEIWYELDKSKNILGQLKTADNNKILNDTMRAL